MNILEQERVINLDNSLELCPYCGNDHSGRLKNLIEMRLKTIRSNIASEKIAIKKADIFLKAMDFYRNIIANVAKYDDCQLETILQFSCPTCRNSLSYYIKNIGENSAYKLVTYLLPWNVPSKPIHEKENGNVGVTITEELCETIPLQGSVGIENPKAIENGLLPDHYLYIVRYPGIPSANDYSLEG